MAAAPVESEFAPLLYSLLLIVSHLAYRWFQ